MEWEWLRFITMILAGVAIIQLSIFGRRTREPAVIAPISWLLLVVGYSIFKHIVGSDLDYYSATVLWLNIILIVGIILIIAGGIVFRDIKSWTFRR